MLRSVRVVATRFSICFCTRPFSSQMQHSMTVGKRRTPRFRCSLQLVSIMNGSEDISCFAPKQHSFSEGLSCKSTLIIITCLFSIIWTVKLWEIVFECHCFEIRVNIFFFPHVVIMMLSCSHVISWLSKNRTLRLPTHFDGTGHKCISRCFKQNINQLKTYESTIRK